MDTIRIKNFRSIVDSEDIKINKINVLLGRNSSGKSSFVRLFPMLRATAKHELRGPILWFDENYDFGSFSNSICRHRTSDSNFIMFGFDWKYEKREISTGRYNIRKDPKGFLANTSKFKVNIYMSEFNGHTILSRLDLNTDSDSVVIRTIEGHENRLEVILNDRKLKIEYGRWDYSTKGVLPNIHFGAWRQAQDVLQSIINNHLKQKGFDLTIISLMSTICDVSSSDIEQIHDMLQYNLVNQGGYELENFDTSSEDFQKFCDYIFIDNIVETLYYIDKELTDDFSHSYYITPLRYSNERYMRNRDLSVANIESSGKNVMDYVLSLSDKERESYSKFLNDTLKCHIDIIGEETRSIFITNEYGETDNIVDVGHGFSQILPIATMFWDRAYKGHSRRSQDYIVIEQPEVHLHPHMQGNIAVLLVEAIKIANQKRNNLRFIIETHSAVLVNRLGKYIYNSKAQDYLADISKIQSRDGSDISYRFKNIGINDKLTINRDDVSVYLFEKNDKGVTSITSTEYDDNGRVKKWPLGFLD